MLITIYFMKKDGTNEKGQESLVCSFSRKPIVSRYICRWSRGGCGWGRKGREKATAVAGGGGIQEWQDMDVIVIGRLKKNL